MKQFILNTTILMVSSLLCTLQASSCSQAKNEEQQNLIGSFMSAFDSFRQGAHNTKIRHNNSSSVELDKTTATGNDLAHTADEALNKKRDKTSRISIGLSKEEAQFVDNVGQKDLELAENRKRFEALIERVRKFLNKTIQPGVDSMMQKGINSLEQKREVAIMLGMPPRAVLKILSNQPIESEKKNKAIGIIKNVIQNYPSTKGITTIKELLLQFPDQLIATLSQGLNKVEEIKPLFADTAEVTIKQLPKKLNELLLLHKQCEAFKHVFNFLLDSPSLSILPEIQKTFSTLEVLHKKIDNNSNHAGELRDILSELKKVYKRFLENYESSCAILPTFNDEQDFRHNFVEAYFLVLEVIYTHHYGLLLVQKTIEGIKNSTNS